MNPDEYDISKDWQYLFDIVKDSDKVEDYDTMFNDPIVRKMIDKIDEQEEEETGEQISKKELILRGKLYNDEQEEEYGEEKEEISMETMNNLFNFISGIHQEKAEM